MVVNGHNQLQQGLFGVNIYRGSILTGLEAQGRLSKKELKKLFEYIGGDYMQHSIIEDILKYIGVLHKPYKPC